MAKVVITIPATGGSGGTSIHNQLSGLQGGDIANSEFYHFDQTQYNKLLDLIYTDLSINFSNTPITGERGLSTAITLNYNIQSNDDIITSASINQGVGNILSNVDQGNQSISGGNRVNTTTYTLSYNYTRNGNNLSGNQSTTYTTYLPQWSGITSNDSLNASNYNTINAILQKVVQSTDTISRDLSPTNQYIWFVSTNNNAVITNNGFNTIIGEWNSTTAFFIKQTVNLTLADGTTVGSLTFYRSRQLLTHSTQNYTIT